MRWRLPDGKLLRAGIPWIVLALALMLTVAGWVAHEHGRAARARAEFKRRRRRRGGRARRAHGNLRAAPAGVRRARRLGTLAHHGQVARVRRLPRPAALLPRAAVPRLLARARLGAGGRPGAARRDPARQRERCAGDLGEGHARRTRDIAGGEAGFSIVAPLPRAASAVYAGGLHGAPRAAWVAGDVRIHDLLRGLLDARTLEVLDLRIYDGERVEPAAVLVDTRTESSGEPRFERTVALARYRDAPGPCSSCRSRSSTRPSSATARGACSPPAAP